MCYLPELTNPQYLLIGILHLKEGQAAWPRRPLFPAIGSAARTAQIVQALVFLKKKPSNFSQINSSPSLLSRCFSKKPSNFTKINLQSRPFKWAGMPPARACIWTNLGLVGSNSA